MEEEGGNNCGTQGHMAGDRKVRVREVGLTPDVKKYVGGGVTYREDGR